MGRNTPEILFDYLQDIFYNSEQAKLDVDSLEEDFATFGKGLVYFAQCIAQYRELAIALGKGDLSTPLPSPENELAAPLKSLQASLKHLTWQSQQVAKGDYKQHVDFMGEFSNAFNQMIQQLAERQERLEQEINRSNNKSMALEQSNKLLTNITQNIPQQIIVVNSDTKAINFLNDSAWVAIDLDNNFVNDIVEKMSGIDETDGKRFAEIQIGSDANKRYLAVHSYMLEWNREKAEAFVIDDISEGKKRMETLENYAYHDVMTRLYNRVYGMFLLNQWLEEKRNFILVFVDLDNLKYINDNYGHSEGDLYIISTARYLELCGSDNAVACRIGGDEFMLLLPDTELKEAYELMENFYNALRSDDYLQDKEYYYSASYGIASAIEDDIRSASELLSLADERMYNFKRMKKKGLQN